MPRYKNGELLGTELPQVEEQPQQQESAGRIVLPDGTTTSSGVYNAASNQQANTGMVSTAAGQNTNRGDKRTPLTYTGLDGETKLDPRGASAVLTQVAQSQMDEPTMQESERTRAALERLEAWDQNRVGAYTGRYDAQIDDILGSLGNREGFSYNPEEDQLYRNYRDLYLRMGNRAMQDSMANSAALTGGYGNSYGAAVGQQQYQDYVSRLNEQLPNLYDRAYQRWQNEGDDLYQRLGAYMDMDSRDYGRYRDQVADWQNDRAYYANRYDTETGNDMSRYDRDLAQWQADRDYYYNMLMHGMMDDPVTAAAVQSMIGGTGAGGGSGSGSGSGSGNGGGDRSRLSGKSGSGNSSGTGSGLRDWNEKLTQADVLQTYFPDVNSNPYYLLREGDSGNIRGDGTIRRALEDELPGAELYNTAAQAQAMMTPEDLARINQFGAAVQDGTTQADAARNQMAGLPAPAARQTPIATTGGAGRTTGNAPTTIGGTGRTTTGGTVREVTPLTANHGALSVSDWSNAGPVRRMSDEELVEAMRNLGVVY